MILAFIGVFLLSAGIEQSAQCARGTAGSCSEILPIVLFVAGALLMIGGVALMLTTQEPVTAFFVYKPVNAQSSTTSRRPAEPDGIPVPKAPSRREDE
jgi:predicted phage tail protein